MIKVSKVIACILGTISILYFLCMLLYVPISLYLSVYLLFSFLCFLYAYLVCHHKQGIFSTVNKKIKNIMLIFLSCIILSFISVEGMVIYYGNKHYEDKVDYILVLGAEVKGDTISTSLKYRLEAAYELYLKQPDTMIVVSGGKGTSEKNSEAYYMKQYLIEKGIPSSSIIKEDKSTNTNENFKFSKKILDVRENEDYEVIVVTNGFHSFRSQYIAKKLGMKAHAYSAKSHGMTAPHFYIREYFAFVKDFVVLNI